MEASARHLTGSIKRNQFLADTALVGVTAVWGLTFVLVDWGLRLLPPLPLVSIRFLLAALPLVLLCLPRIGKLRRVEWWAGCWCGICLIAGYVFQAWGQTMTTPAKSGFITGLSVVIVPVLAIPLLRQRPSRPTLALTTIQITVAACGMTLGWIIGAGVGFQLPQIQVAVALIMADVRIAGALVMLGIVATTLTTLVQVKAQRQTTATHTALIFTLEPVFAGLFAYLFIGELLTIHSLIGGGFILVGTSLAVLGDIT